MERSVFMVGSEPTSVSLSNIAPRDIVELRRVRLFHWRKVCQASVRRGDRRCSPFTRKDWDAQWTLHMGFVQSLNAFFPIGDTAERDSVHMIVHGRLPGEEPT